MLQFIRARVTSIFVKVLFGVLIVSFAIWGIGDIFLGSPGGRTAISVGEVQYNSVQVLEQFDRVRRNVGASLSAREAADLGLMDTVIDQMVNDGLFQAESRALNLRAGEDLLRRNIADSPAFRDQLGAFSAERFRQILFNLGLSEESFLNQLRSDITRGQIAGAVSAGATAPAAFTDLLYRYRQERRRVRLVRLPTATVTGLPTADDAALRGWYDENREDYRAPEYRSATYVLLTPDDLAPQILVTAEEIETEYEARRGHYTTPATRDVDQIYFADETAARQAAARLAQGGDFAAVARELAETGEDPVLPLGPLRREDLPNAAIADAVFQTEAGAVTDALQSDLGWHLFRVNAATEETVRPLSDVTAEIRLDLAREKALDTLFDLANQLEDTLAGGATLEEAAAALDVTARRLAPVDAQGRDTAGLPVEGLPAGERFLHALMETGEGEQSALGETDDNGYFLLRVDGVTESAIRPFEMVREAVLDSWRAEQRRIIAERQAQALQRDAGARASLSAAAADAGLRLETPEPFTRAGQGLAEGYPGDLAAIAFGLETGGVGLSSSDIDFVVVELAEILAADPGAAGSGAGEDPAAAIRQELTAGTASDLVEMLVAGLRRHHDVSIDRGYIDSLLRDAQ